MHYMISDNGALSIFDDGSDVPFLLQPTWPDGTPWKDEAEITVWAEAKIAELTDESAPIAGNSPNAPTLPRPSKLDELLARSGMTKTELIELLG